MFRFRRKKDKTTANDTTSTVTHPNDSTIVDDRPAPQQESTDSKESLFSKLKKGLRKTRSQFTNSVANLFLGKKTISPELLEELENQLLIADTGVEATTAIINELTQGIERKQLNNGEAVYAALQEKLRHMLLPVCQELQIPESQAAPFVILMVGINGAGKTTTIGKLAKRFQSQGKSVLLAAGDTFRAAAVEQLQVWGQRNNIAVVAQQSGADSASVVYDALQSAKAKNIDVVIADTAGRLHTQTNLMEELKKVKRVMQKLDATAPHETMLVLDAGTGQNALSQAIEFNEMIGLSGITVTKLDGTAKGGIVFALAKRLALPIRFLGMGEGIDDLKPFAAQPFIEALLAIEEDSEPLS